MALSHLKPKKMLKKLLPKSPRTWSSRTES